MCKIIFCQCIYVGFCLLYFIVFVSFCTFPIHVRFFMTCASRGSYVHRLFCPPVQFFLLCNNNNQKEKSSDIFIFLFWERKRSNPPNLIWKELIIFGCHSLPIMQCNFAKKKKKKNSNPFYNDGNK